MTRREGILAGAVVLLALALREWFVLATAIVQPASGDVSSYMRYAIHMVLDGTFSEAGPGLPATPDAYRGPGYPLFIAAFYSPDWSQWWAAVAHAQAVLGAATVGIVVATARTFLPMRWAALAGVLLAVQPHHIAASAVMLSEVWLGFLLAAGVWLAILRRPWLAGMAFGLAYLTNPIAALLPAAMLPLFWRDGWKRDGVIVVAVAALAVGGWAARSAAHGLSGNDRAGVNLVQGAWPDYHAAAKLYPLRSDYRQVMDSMHAEVALMKQSRADGLRSVAERIAAEPGRFALWYAVEKPYLLWAWDIKMGAGGVYTHHVKGSPLDGPLWLLTAIQWALTPILFGLALLGCIVSKGPARYVAVAFLYVTAVHVVFQAEPRYATAYRWAEVTMAAYALHRIARRVDQRNLGIGKGAVVDLNVEDAAAGRVGRIGGADVPVLGAAGEGEAARRI